MKKATQIEEPFCDEFETPPAVEFRTPGQTPVQTSAAVVAAMTAAPPAKPPYVQPPMRPRTISDEEIERLHWADTRMPEEIRAEYERTNAPPETKVAALRAIPEAQEKFEAVQFEFEAKKTAALELQGEYESLCARLVTLTNEIFRGESQLAASQTLAKEADAGFDNWLERSDCTQIGFAVVTNTATSYQQHSWIAERLPAWIAGRKTRLESLNAQLTAFRKKHGLAQ